MAGKLQIVIVTPEKTTLDQEAEFVVLPMVDGEAGFLPGAAPMIGRLGAGELRIRNGGKEERYFIDGGFAQIENNVLSVLPSQSLPAADVKLADAEAALTAALALPSDAPELNAVKQKAVALARAQKQFAEKS